MVKFLTTIVLTFCMLNASATIVGHNGYLSDDSTSLDWLDFSVTMGLSYTEAEAKHSGNWRHATHAEVDQYFFNWFGNIKMVDNPNISDGSVLVSAGSASDIKADKFLELHGTMYVEQKASGSYGFYRETGTWIAGMGVVSVLEKSFLGSVGDSMIVNTTAFIPYPGSMNSEDYKPDRGGWFMVRATQPAVVPAPPVVVPNPPAVVPNPPAVVPEPSAIALMGLGLLGFAATRHRKNQT